MIKNHLPRAADKVLFTPGPLTTSALVKQAQLRDLGSRDLDFISVVRDVRSWLLKLGEVDPSDYTAVIMQGSGTFGLESVVGSVIPPSGKLLTVVNGAYGRRIAQIANILQIQGTRLDYPEYAPVSPEDISQRLDEDPGISHVAVCHCETTSGILNPVVEIGHIVAGHGGKFIVDAMSSFGAIPLKLNEACVDFMVSSANKCIEGVPGFSFILAKKESLFAAKGWARSLSLDLFAQYEGLEGNGQFRFTPPVQSLLAFHQALKELEDEGGVPARNMRYMDNHETLMRDMIRIGFKPYLSPEFQSPIITSFHYPEHPAFDFERFYSELSASGYVIYPGKVGDAECFRIGSIGRLTVNDVMDLTRAIDRVLMNMGVSLH